MSELAEWVFFLLVFPGMLFAVALGFAMSWVDRKVTALVQMRKGPPLTQPFWDVVKLLGKEVVVPVQAWAAGFLALPFVAFSAAALAGTLVWLAATGLATHDAALAAATPFRVEPLGDLIVVLYLLVIPTLAVILGGSASGNPLGAVGASRDMKLMLAYELPFVVAILAALFQFGDQATLSLTGHVENQAAGSVILRPSGILAFLVALFCAHAKLGFVPFDLAEAECEIGEGALLEYSGAGLAFFKLTQTVLLATMPVFLVTIFWGGIDPGPWGLAAFAGKVVLILVLFVLIKNTNPRVRIDQAMRFFWGPATAVALVALLLAELGL